MLPAGPISWIQEVVGSHREGKTCPKCEHSPLPHNPSPNGEKKIVNSDDIKTPSLSLPSKETRRVSSSTREYAWIPPRRSDRPRKFRDRIFGKIDSRESWIAERVGRNWDDKRIAGNRRYRVERDNVGFHYRGGENLVCERISGLRAAVSRGIDAVHRSLIAPRSGSLKIITLEWPATLDRQSPSSLLDRRQHSERHAAIYSVFQFVVPSEIDRSTGTCSHLSRSNYYVKPARINAVGLLFRVLFRVMYIMFYYIGPIVNPRL